MIEADNRYKNQKRNSVIEFTEVKPSPIEGFGLFAKKLIPKGTIWWSATAGDVLLISHEQFRTLEKSQHSPPIKDILRTILIYSYYVKSHDALVFLLDNTRYINHSFTPNSVDTPDSNPFASMALRDIHPGEEILEDYTSFDQCPWTSFHEDFLPKK